MRQLGKWISNRTAKPFYARKEFECRQGIAKATAYVCGLGQFHFYLNGRKVGNHELDPGWTNYDKLVQYVTFDVGEYLTEGRNVAGAEVGNGWYHADRERYFMSMPPNRPEFSFLPPNPNPYQPFAEFLTLNVRLVIDYADGSREEILTDDTWKTCPHYVTMSNVYGSEIIDNRLRQEGFSEAGYEEKGWQNAAVLTKEEAPKGALMNQYQPPVTVKRTYEAACIGEVNGRKIYDFGQNMSGILEFEIRGKSGQKADFFPAEKLAPDGDVDQMAKGWTPIDVCITAIVGQDDTWESCRQKFTYFAGRYLAVEGTAQVRSIQAHYITSDSKDTGSFTCDDKRLEQIYDLVYKAVESNLLSVHTDCPTIERYAWQEPNHLMGPSIMYMKDVRVLWDKILLDLRTDQCTADDWYYDLEGEKWYPGEGMMPSQAPCYEHNVLPAPGLGSFFDIIPWGSSCILAAYWHYKFYGDKKIIEDNYEAGMKYLSYLKTRVTEDGFINHGLGDWGNPDQSALARENVETVFLYADAVTLARFAAILGRTEDMIELEDYARTVKDNYNEKLLVRHPKEGFWCYRAWDHPDETFLTQACEAMPLYWGMVPVDKAEDVKRALAWVLERDKTFVSGEVGLPYIIQSMSECGMHDKIIDFILREEHPSYYAFVLAGETTLGEYWEDNPRSHNHDMMGHIVEWYYNGIAGIRPLKPGFEEILVKPYLPKTATCFTCTYQSVYGEICVKVSEEADRIIVNLTVPDGTLCQTDDTFLKMRKPVVEWVTN